VDPHTWDLPAVKAELGGKVCLWGGVNGHLTVEQGRPEDIRNEVRRALELLAPGGGFVLSPVDNVRIDSEQSRANVQVLLEEWRNPELAATPPMGWNRQILNHCTTAAWPWSSSTGGKARPISSVIGAPSGWAPVRRR